LELLNILLQRLPIAAACRFQVVAGDQQPQIKPLQGGKSIAIGGDNVVIRLRPPIKLEDFVAFVNQLFPPRLAVWGKQVDQRLALFGSIVTPELKLTAVDQSLKSRIEGQGRNDAGLCRNTQQPKCGVPETENEKTSGCQGVDGNASQRGHRH